MDERDNDDAQRDDDVDVDVDVDAEGEVDGGGQMALISPGGMAALSAATNVNGGVGKRYRPAPAKTFQCRGYGECRMVFSRSEHLARHIRKHTGERPFTCHCSKQFSRLDNLRQHAQTVHADRAEANERMMRELGALHAGMVTAAGGTPAGVSGTSPSTTKKGGARRARASAASATAAPAPAAAAAALTTHNNGGGASPPSPPVKPEPTEPVIPVRRRPGTSTGYEGEMEVDRGEEPRAAPRPTTASHRTAPSPPHPPAAPGRAHSFRGEANLTPTGHSPATPDAPYQHRPFLGGDRSSTASGQSFRGHPYARRSPPEHPPSPPAHNVNGFSGGRTASGGSYAFQSGSRPYSSGTGAFHSPTGGNFPSSFPATPGSRPSTGNGSGARLPPLSAIVSAAAFRPTSGHGLPAPGVSGSILLPNSLTLRRPSTSDWDWDAWGGRARPGTAPGKLATAAGAGDDSPFSFHPPDQPASAAAVSPSVSYFGGNPRKRTLGGPDGPYGSHPDDRGGSSGGYEYEYGSESRPTSRRLSVMELCNDDENTNAAEQRPPSSSVALSSLLRAQSVERERERPTTTNGLVARASALVLDDHHDRELVELRQYAGEQSFAADPFAFGVAGPRSRSGSLRGRDAVASGGSAAAHARAGAGGRGDGAGGGVSAAPGGGSAFLSSSAAAAAGGGGAGAGASARGGAVSFSAAPAPAAAGIPRPIPGASSRDGDGDVSSSPTSGGAYGYASAGRVSTSPPSGGGLPRLFGVPPHVSAAGLHDRPRSSTLGGPPGLAVFARVPSGAVGAHGVPLRADDAFLGVRRRGDDGLRYSGGGGAGGGGVAEVRELAAGGRGAGAAGYEYEYDHDRIGGGRGGGMRV